MPKLSSCLVLAIGFLASSAVRCEPPTAYPDFDAADASPVLVVALVQPGKYMPQFPGCDEPDTICMDPPPFWFKATVISTVYGFSPQRELQVATTSHFGMSAYENNRTKQLVLLETDGRSFVMPRYARTNLVEDKRGDLYLPVFRTYPIWWLPCTVSELQEEIAASEFKSDLEIARDEFDEYDVEEHPGLFRMTRNGAVPRFAISINRVRAHLQSLAPSASEMSCEREDAK